MNTWRRVRSACTIIALSLCFNFTGRAQISSYGVTKTGYYSQGSEGASALESGNNHYFDAFVNPDGLADIDSALLRAPGGLQLEMAPVLFFFQGFTTQAGLDNLFGNGTYSLQITTVDLDFFFAQLNLAGGYPTIPHVSNFAAGQSIAAAADFTLHWDPFVDGTTGDAINVTIDDDSGSTVFQASGQGPNGGLTGQETSVLIPAGTLAPGTNYLCTLTFTKVSTLDGSSISGAVGVAAYVRQTSLPLKTAASSTSLVVNLTGFSRQPDGSFLLQVSGTAGATFTVEATTDFANWSGLLTTNPPAGSFSFTDTAAAGLSTRFYRAKAN